MIVTGGELRDCFFDWVRDGRRPRFRIAEIQAALAEMPDVLPEDICEALGHPSGTSIGHAARCLIVVRQHGKEFRIEPGIGFASEEQSMEWWQRNQHNPERVVVEWTGESYRIKIAT
jgi:hypothetical protein